MVVPKDAVPLKEPIMITEPSLRDVMLPAYSSELPPACESKLGELIGTGGSSTAEIVNLIICSLLRPRSSVTVIENESVPLKLADGV